MRRRALRRAAWLAAVVPSGLLLAACGGSLSGATTSPAVAGGGIWVAGGNRLLHLSLPGGRVLDSSTLPGAVSSDLSANAAGTVLTVGQADSGGGAVQRRDPGTGRSWRPGR